MALARRARVNIGHVSAEALAAAARKRDFVRVETKGESLFLFVGCLCVRVFPKSPASEKLANALALAVCEELDREFSQRAAWVAKESRYREVKHY